MYGSMCLMMILDVVFVKLIVSVMSTFPRGATVIPWLILVIALMRVGRKMQILLSNMYITFPKTLSEPETVRGIQKFE